MNKSRHYVLADLLTWFGINLVMEKWFNQTLCVSYFTELILGSFGYGPVNKSRHYVLDNQPDLLGDHFVMNLWIKADTMCYLIHWLDECTFGITPVIKSDNMC